MIAPDRRGNVLTLDLATSTGWCLGAFGTRPRFGAISLGGQEPVQRMAALREWLDAMDRLQSITAVVVEAAILGQFSSQQAERVTLALHSMVELWGYDIEVPVVRIASSTARAQVLGTARFEKGSAKRHVGEWCERQGFGRPGDDAADAILTWHAAEAISLGMPRAGRGLLAPVRAA